jgi:hypothetical protein
MRDFAFGQAVLAGFDLLRRRPWVTLGVALIGMVASLVVQATSIVSTHFMVATIGRPSAPAIINLVAVLTNLLALLMVASIIGPAVMRGGRPRLGGDEARLFILSQLTWLALLIVLLAIGVGAAISSLGGSQPAGKSGVMSLATGVGVILVLGLASRLWLAGPMTVQDGRLRLMASWRLTRGRSWKVFGAFLVALTMAAGVAVLGNMALAKATSGLKLSADLAYDPSLTIALTGIIRPIRLAYGLIQGLLFGLALVIQVAPAAFIRRSLAGDPVSDQAAVFD